MRTQLIGLAAVFALAASTPALAGDAAAGQAKAGLCAACHGPTGKAISDVYPNLCGQNEKYLLDALNQYRSGKRDNPLMKPMVAALNDADAENLAAFYASQPCE